MTVDEIGREALVDAAPRAAKRVQNRFRFLSPDEVLDLLHDAVLLLLSGERTWDRERVDLVGFLAGVVQSLVSGRSKGTERHVVKAHLVPTPPEPDTPEELLAAAEAGLLAGADVEAEVFDDPELSALWSAVSDGETKRGAIAGELGWHVGRVTAARIKLQRRLRSPNRHRRDGRDEMTDLITILDWWRDRFGLSPDERTALATEVTREVDGERDHPPMPAELAHKIGSYTFRHAVDRIMSERLVVYVPPSPDGPSTERSGCSPPLEAPSRPAKGEDPTGKVVRRCSVCREPGHRIESCPRKPAESPPT